MNFGGDHPAHGHGKISLRCVHEGASDEKNTSSRQYIAAMYSDSANFGKICVPCIQKAPQSAVGEYAARTSCRQGAFSPSEALESCTARKSCHPLMDLALAQGCLPPSASPIPHTLPLRKNEAAKLAKNFAKRVIPTPQTRFRRLSGEICPKRVPRLLLSAHFEYVSRSSWHRPANSAYVWTKSRPIGAETPFEKQKCTRKSKSSPRARACGTHQHHRMPHALSLRGKRTYNVPTYNWQRLAARVRRCLVAAGE